MFFQYFFVKLLCSPGMAPGDLWGRGCLVPPGSEQGRVWVLEPCQALELRGQERTIPGEDQIQPHRANSGAGVAQLQGMQVQWGFPV